MRRRVLKKSPLQRNPARTIPIPGYGDDAGRWFRCWNCGFICDSERDLIDPTGQRGVEVVEYSLTSAESRLIEPGVYAHAGGPFVVGVTMRLDSDGSYTAPNRLYRRSVTGGCPSCGIKNWRGDR
jgi:hypothetical protein